jgi:hypothetical protein
MLIHYFSGMFSRSLMMKRFAVRLLSMTLALLIASNSFAEE